MWIQGIARGDQGFALNTVFPTSTCLHPLQQLSAKLPGTTRRKRITTDCRSWQRHSAAPFWDYLGIRPEHDNHAVFELVDENQQYLIPASVFITAVMRPIKTMQAFLFHPQGLDLMCVPLLGGDKPTVGFHEPEYITLGGQRSRHENVLAGLSWMHCFPSARAMWGSVFKEAQDEKLALTLPAATMTMILHSVKHGNYRLVTGITLVSLSANEQPYDFAVGHPTELVLHDSAGLDWSVAHNPPKTLNSRNGEWHLSDKEWHNVETLLPPIRTTAKYDRRAILDLIVTKIGSGTPWRCLDFGPLNFNLVQATYRSLSRSGHWRSIENLINEMRALKGHLMEVKT